MTYAQDVDALGVWTELVRNKYVALLGGAGVGKTYRTREVIDHAYDAGYDVVVTASTGLAARGLSPIGITINTALKFQVSKNIEDYESKKYLQYQKIAVKRDRTLLIIDEVSMISREVFDLIFHILERRKISPLILVVGDFLQLPPVTKSNESVNFAFESNHFEKFSIIEPTVNMRNKDARWNKFLNRLRFGTYSEEDKTFLLDYAKRTPEVEGFTTLDSRNVDVDKINEDILNKLDGEELYAVGRFVKRTSYENEFTTVEWEKFEEDVKKSIITPHLLKIKNGARVIITKNNAEFGYVNGDTGVITGFLRNGEGLVTSVEIMLDNCGVVMTVAEANFDVFHPTRVSPSDGKPIVIASYLALPIKLAWALTTSKSQGMSIRSVKVLPENFFLPAEAYVAFSRCGETLVLDNYDFGQKVKVSKKAVDFYTNIQKNHTSFRETVSADDLDKLL